MWMQLSDPGLFQVLHKSQSWPIRLALLSHLQPRLEFPGAAGDVGHGGSTRDTAGAHTGCVLGSARAFVTDPSPDGLKGGKNPSSIQQVQKMNSHSSMFQHAALVCCF